MTLAAYDPPWMPPWATPGVAPALLPRLHGRVADHEDLRMTGQGQVGPDQDAARAVGLGTGRGRHLAGERRGDDAGAPEDGPRGDGLLGCLACRRSGGPERCSHRCGSRSCRCAPRRRVARAGACADADRPGGKVGRTRSIASMRMIRASDGSIARKSRRSVSRAISPSEPAEFDAGRPATDQHERHPLATPFRIGFPFRGLEGDEDASPDLDRVLERLETLRVLGPVVVPEERVMGAGRHDERVVRGSGRRPRPGPRACRRRCRSASPRMTVAFRCRDKDRAQGLRDVGRRECAGRDLVEHRLE